MNVFKTLKYFGLGVALIACGDAQDVTTQIDEAALGQVEYSLQRARLSESADVYDKCTSKDASDRACNEALETNRERTERTLDRDDDARASDARSQERPTRERPVAERPAEDESDADRPTRLDSETEPQRPERPQSCEAACEAHAHEAFLDCVETGREAAACRDWAADLIDQCVADRCEAEEEVPQIPTCEARCQHHGRVVYGQCVETGRRPTTCRAYAGRVVESCITNRCEEDEVEPADEVEENRCAHRARQAFARCTRAGGGPDRCRQIARRAHAKCLAALNAVSVEPDTEVEAEPQPPVSQAAGCKRRARHVYNICIENGGSRLRCGALAKKFFAKCMGLTRPQPAPAPAPETDPEITPENEPETTPETDGDTDVEAACDTRAHVHYERCYAATRNDERCTAEARRLFHECVSMHTDEEDETSIVHPEFTSADEDADAAHDAQDHTQACGERARHVYANCIEDGGDPRRCGTVAHRYFDQCVGASR